MKQKKVALRPSFAVLVALVVAHYFHPASSLGGYNSLVDPYPLASNIELTTPPSNSIAHGPLTSDSLSGHHSTNEAGAVGAYYYYPEHNKKGIANRQTNFDLSTFPGGITGTLTNNRPTGTGPTGGGFGGGDGGGGGLGGLVGLLGAIGLPGLLGLKGLKGLLIPLSLLLPLLPLVPVILVGMKLALLLPLLFLLLLIPIPLIVVPSPPPITPPPVITLPTVPTTPTTTTTTTTSTTPMPLPDPTCTDLSTPDCTAACTDATVVTCMCDGLTTTPMCTMMCNDGATPAACTCVDNSVPMCALPPPRYHRRRPWGREIQMDGSNGTRTLGTFSWNKRIARTLVQGAGYIKHHILHMDSSPVNPRSIKFQHNHSSSPVLGRKNDGF